MQDNYTPLILASKNGHVDAVKLLCEVGKANVDIKAGWVSFSFGLYCIAKLSF
jgi:ankyrin repeat protein